MKRKSSKYLEFYKECMKTKILPKNKVGNRNGMCGLFPNDNIFKMMMPIAEDYTMLFEENLERIYWGSGLSANSNGEDRLFTSLRQTIVLFMHEMTVNPIL